MSWRADAKYDTSTPFGSSHDVELPFLPPTASGRSKKQSDIEISHFVEATNSFLPPSYGDAFDISAPRTSRIDQLKQWQPWRYTRLGDETVDPSVARNPFRGWRKAVILAAIVTGLVLLINATFAVVTMLKFKANDGVGIIYQGDCGLIKRWNTALHLMINVLGTALLAASSFTMQCLSSPTRSEVDAAHAKRKSLDIGIPSFKNLFYMSFWKAFLWLCLCLSTLPLHLLWNSTIFSTSGASSFHWLVAEESFLSGASYQKPNDTYPYPYCRGYTVPSEAIEFIFKGYKAGNYTKLSTTDCLDQYTSQYLTTSRNLVMISNSLTNTNMSSCGYSGQIWNGSSIMAMDTSCLPGSNWLHVSGSDDTYSAAVKRAKDQAISHGTFDFTNYAMPHVSYTIDYCLSETKSVAMCELQFISYTLYIVVACNAIKFLSMCAAAHLLWNLNEPILATIGDASASFLERRDDTTKGWCLLDLGSLQEWRYGRTQPRNSIYARKSRARLYAATTRTRWWITITLCTLYLILGFVLFGLSFQLAGYSVTQALKVKFGAADSELLLGLEGASGMGLIIDVIVANSFQLALSTTYFLYNSLYTAQCAALEWASYIQGKRKSLRVTWPRGQQRSTYYLQLPYKYGIPLTLLLVAMHFLISQSIFLARLQYYDGEGALDKNSGFTDVGFSPSAIITTCCVGAVMILAQVFHACRRLDNRIPIHGNSSAVMSAMCHTDENQGKVNSQAVGNIGLLPITWGVTRQATEDGEDTGHCSFSADMVELPQVGKKYQ